MTLEEELAQAIAEDSPSKVAAIKAAIEKGEPSPQPEPPADVPADEDQH